MSKLQLSYIFKCLLFSSASLLAYENNLHLSDLNFKDYVLSVEDVSASELNFAVVNDFIGATSLYEKGVVGWNAKIANIESQIPWLDHEAFTNSVVGQIYIPTGAVSDTGLHASAVSSVMTSLGPETQEGYYSYMSFGIAPKAQLNAAAIATNLGENGAFEISDYTFFSAYSNFFFDNPMDVINSSWGGSGENASVMSQTIDAFISKAQNVTMVVAAGNEGPESNTVGSPANAFNTISVGALGNPNTFDEIASFSSRGACDFFNPVTNTIIKSAIVGVDIVAPGANIVAAGFDTSVALADRTKNEYYAFNGTSFASPIVASAVALLYDTSKMLEANEDAVSKGWSSKARDSRVIKAVLLNSARKPKDWSNNSTFINGVYVTTQGLDYTYGAGILDIDKAFDQYTTFTNDSAWITNSIYQGMELSLNLGFIDAGKTLTSTLVWFAKSSAEYSEETSEIITSDYALANLDLELCLLSDGEMLSVACSISEYATVEHIFFKLLQDGDYYLKVIFNSMVYGDTLASEEFALAWKVAVPEPALFGLIFGIFAVLYSARKRIYK